MRFPNVLINFQRSVPAPLSDVQSGSAACFPFADWLICIDVTIIFAYGVEVPRAVSWQPIGFVPERFPASYWLAQLYTLRDGGDATVVKGDAKMAAEWNEWGPPRRLSASTAAFALRLLFLLLGSAPASSVAAAASALCHHRSPSPREVSLLLTPLSWE